MNGNAAERGLASSPGRVSPSDHFSKSINDLKNGTNPKCNRTMAIVCSALATIFLLSTIALAVVLGVRVAKDDNSRVPTKVVVVGEEEAEEILAQLGPTEFSSTTHPKAQVHSGTVKSASSESEQAEFESEPESETEEPPIPVADESLGRTSRSEWPEPSGSLYAHYRKAAVASDHGLCSEVGRDVMLEGGNAVDSMIATLLCVGVVNPQSSGLGGGFVATLYNRENPNFFLHQGELRRSIFVNSETGRVYEEGDILKRDSLAETLKALAKSPDPVDLFYRGGFAQTISTEIGDKGGILTFDDLAKYETDIDETPVESEELPGDLAMCGPPPPSSFVITQSIIAVMAEYYAHQKVDLNDPLVYHRLIEAEKFAYAQRARLGDIKFVKDAAELTQNMTHKSYIKKIKSLITERAHPLEYYMGSQAMVGVFEPILDDDAQPEDHGTSHVSIIDPYGHAISATSTVNQYFGSMRASPTLGIIWNDEMDDFSTPGQVNAFGFAPSEANFIEPGKRPMSSMSPMIVYNKNDNQVKMVAGASGGSFIISTVAQNVVRTLLFGQTVKEAIDAPRLHNQFIPHRTDYEQGVPKSIIDSLKEQHGQEMNPVLKQKSVAQGLVVLDDGFIHGNSDFRRATSTYPTGF